ncbi:aminotransferase class IV, partial [Mycobacterium tuberculosis]|nr:aminotransferase class IV [Mycobacterium tuberculosis]
MKFRNFTIKLKFWSGYNMHLFETMKLDKGFIPRLDYHYQRISTSSEHLGFQFDHLFWKQFIHNI